MRSPVLVLLAWPSLVNVAVGLERVVDEDVQISPVIDRVIRGCRRGAWVDRQSPLETSRLRVQIDVTDEVGGIGRSFGSPDDRIEMIWTGVALCQLNRLGAREKETDCGNHGRWRTSLP